MVFDPAGPGNRLVAIVDGLASVNAQQLGVAESPTGRLTVSVTLGSIASTRIATTIAAYDIGYRLLFAYRLDGDEVAAELALMSYLAALYPALLADLTLAGTCEGIEIDTSGADEPEYAMTREREWREYPVRITARQYGTFSAA